MKPFVALAVCQQMARWANFRCTMVNSAQNSNENIIKLSKNIKVPLLGNIHESKITAIPTSTIPMKIEKKDENILTIIKSTSVSFNHVFSTKIKVTVFRYSTRNKSIHFLLHHLHRISH